MWDVTVTIARWGNSLGIRIPRAALEEARMREGDRVEIVCHEGQLTIAKSQRRTLDELLAKMTPENGHEDLVPNTVGNERW
jgi:antitoxin MazE